MSDAASDEKNGGGETRVVRRRSRPEDDDDDDPTVKYPESARCYPVVMNSAVVIIFREVIGK